MDSTQKLARYQRITEQLEGLLKNSHHMPSRMATATAVLHHKMEPFFWTGFYMLHEGELLVEVYQGPLACQKLEKGKGVCWAAILENRSLVVPDVHKFPGHIACDSRSNSEIVIPVHHPDGTTIGVLDIDSVQFAAFDEVDAFALETIVKLIFNPESQG